MVLDYIIVFWVWYTIRALFLYKGKLKLGLYQNENINKLLDFIKGYNSDIINQ